MCGVWWVFLGMLRLLFYTCTWATFSIHHTFQAMKLKIMQHPTFKCIMKNRSVHSKFTFKKSVLLQILEERILLQNGYLRRRSGLQLSAAKGGGAQGNVNTVAVYKPSGEQLQRAPPCLHLKDAQRSLTSSWTWSSHACGCRGLPLLFTHSLMGVHTSRTSSSSHDEFWANTVWHPALCSGCSCIEHFG